MKFKVEVDIDWLGEDWTLDEKIQFEIMNKVEDKLVERLIAGFDDDFVKKTSERAEKLIDDKINEFVDNFMGKEFTRVDEWGDVIEENVNVKQLLKDRLDKFLSEKVNSKGQVSRRSYDNNTNRIDYVLNEIARKHIEKYQQGVSDDVLRRIKEDINNQTREKVVDSILNDYSLKRLVGPLN